MTGLSLRIGCGLVLAAALAPGCGHVEKRIAEPTASPDGESTQSQAGQDTAIKLQYALIPSSTAQPVRIRVVEHRVTDSAETGSTTQDLDLDLRARLKAVKTRDDRTVEATLRFEQIRLKIGPPEPALTYDSRSDKRGKGNSLADLMEVVADAELNLLIGPDGRLLELHGLNHKWRTAGIILPPPHLLTAQWLFRDNSMLELISEALFPVMPPGSVQVGDTWETSVPADIPLAVRLDSCLGWSVSSIANNKPASVEVQLDGNGQVQLAASPLKDAPPGIRPHLKTGTHTAKARVCPKTGAFQQTSGRLIEVELTLTPPAGKERLRATIRQERRLTAQRGTGPG